VLWVEPTSLSPLPRELASTDVHDPGLPASSIRAMLGSDYPVIWWISDTPEITAELEVKP